MKVRLASIASSHEHLSDEENKQTKLQRALCCSCAIIIRSGQMPYARLLSGDRVVALAIRYRS